MCTHVTWGRAFFQLGKPQLIEEFCWTNQMSYSCLVWIVFISFHVGLMKCMLSSFTAPQHLVCRTVQSLHINHMQMSIIEVFICRRLHMNTSMILICIWLICRLCTALHTKCCGAVLPASSLTLPCQLTGGTSCPTMICPNITSTITLLISTYSDQVTVT